MDFVSFYFGEPDGTGHRYGPDSNERREMVKQVDRTVGYIRQSAERHGLTHRLNIIITADHGMTTVYRNGLVEEITLSKIPGFSFGDLSFHLVDYGPSGMLLPKPGRLEAVYNALKGAHPHLHVYKKEDMPEHLRFTKNDRILPIILWYFPVQFNKGEHGYDNQAMDMKPFFRAVGPAFHKNLKVGPFETVNIYPLMCHILGIEPEVNDGHLDATKHIVCYPCMFVPVNLHYAFISCHLPSLFTSHCCCNPPSMHTVACQLHGFLLEPHPLCVCVCVQRKGGG
uniref:Ectonucleotide pyrophosphatase/phosphodiesterase 7 n=1 Tax=Neolamprologus brichardi TaxID=32507 RepID=A0A3Q4GZX3_NEOBR